MTYVGQAQLPQQELTSVRRLRESAAGIDHCPTCGSKLAPGQECAKCGPAAPTREHGTQGMKWGTRKEKPPIGKTQSGKDIPHGSHSTYTAHSKLPKYSGTVSVHSAHGSDAGKLLRSRLPDFSKQDHADAAQAHHDAASKADKAWSKTADDAAQKAFGRPFQATDYHISGIGSDKFDDKSKDKLRDLAHSASDHKSAADAHERAGRNARS